MNEISSFMFSEHTMNGYPVIGAGICPSAYKNTIASEIKEKNNKIGYEGHRRSVLYRLHTCSLC